MFSNDEKRITLNVIALNDKVEEYLRNNIVKDETGTKIILDSHISAIIMNEIDEKYNWCKLNGFNNVPIICRPDLRLYFRRLIEKNFPRIQVISYMEIPPDYKLEVLCSIEFKGYRNINL
ncbi:MAG: hypothetical protein KatS3mg068_1696 [Candidatus Sericytochromatia bacterium]|nr:MAG: hypothetical protein KatS3mg068_1696 [Candidatus Sericytochromatia bacterium]